MLKVSRYEAKSVPTWTQGEGRNQHVRINDINATLLDQYPNEKMEISGQRFRVRRDFCINLEGRVRRRGVINFWWIPPWNFTCKIVFSVEKATKSPPWKLRKFGNHAIFLSTGHVDEFMSLPSHGPDTDSVPAGTANKPTQIAGQSR